MKVKQLHPDAVKPTRANDTDAGLDLVSIEDVIIQPGDRKAVRTGIAIAIDPGYVGLIWPRSGLSLRNGVNTLAGVIDSSYRGEIKVVLHNTDQLQPVVLNKGSRIAQMLVQAVDLSEPYWVDELDETVRGENGFGSTGG